MKTEKIKYFSLFLLLIIFIFPVYNAKSNNQNGIKEYKNSKNKVKFNYPADWTTGKKQKGTEVSIQSPMYETMNLVIQNFDQKDTNFEQFSELTVKTLAGVFKDFQIVSSEYVTINGNKAYKIIYNITSSEMKMTLLQMWTIKNKKIYIFTFGTLESNFGNSLPAFTLILNSIEIN